MRERLTNAQLARMESDAEVARGYYARHGKLPTSTGLDVIELVPRVVAELRARREADLSAEEVEALEFARRCVLGDWGRELLTLSQDERRQWEADRSRARRSLALLTRLIVGGAK